MVKKFRSQLHTFGYNILFSSTGYLPDADSKPKAVI